METLICLTCEKTFDSQLCVCGILCSGLKIFGREIFFAAGSNYTQQTFEIVFLIIKKITPYLISGHCISFKDFSFEYLRGWVDGLPDEEREPSDAEIPPLVKYPKVKQPGEQMSDEAKKLYLYFELDCGQVRRLSKQYRRKAEPVQVKIYFCINMSAAM